MAHAVEMYFDDQAEAAVRRLWQVLADGRLPSADHRDGLCGRDQGHGNGVCYLADRLM